MDAKKMLIDIPVCQKIRITFETLYLLKIFIFCTCNNTQPQDTKGIVWSNISLETVQMEKCLPL